MRGTMKNGDAETRATSSREELQAKLDEAYTILAALDLEYNEDEQCDYKVINHLIERGAVLLSDGPVAAKAYGECWGGDRKPSDEASAEYARYCDRGMEIMRLRHELEDTQKALSLRSETTFTVPAGWKLVPIEPTEEMLKAIEQGGMAPPNVGDDAGWRLWAKADWQHTLKHVPPPPAVTERGPSK